jgi:hypothetical protein
MVSTPPAAPARKARALAERLLDGLVLRAHRLADRFEWQPPEFGRESPVDEADPHAVLAEWIRCLRLWASYSPEQVFALKAGAAMLLTVLVALWVVIGLIH